ncbi:hypothetical protein N9B73_02485 [Verrucomicrobiales bacterium]|nr:hypothetical protein [Verrucomicrobiales bacterium]
MKFFCLSLFVIFSSSLLVAEINIEARGKLIDDCTLEGEQKKDWLHPSHPYCAQLSAGRFLWIYQTRGFSGVDSEHLIIYQLRSDTPDGPFLKEGFISRYREDWEVHRDGRKFIKSHGHPNVTGVPKGVVDDKGRAYPSENMFLATWYVIPATRDLQTGVVDRVDANQLESIHFRLNDEESDIEFLDDEITIWREKGFERGGIVCSVEPRQTSVNQWLVPATALDERKTRWVDTYHFGKGIAAVEIAFDEASRLYQWVRTGKLVNEHVRGKLMEGSLNRLGPDDWVLGARARGHHWGKGAYGYCVAWYRTSDPFAGFGESTYTKVPSSYCPKPSHLCPDGVLRVMSGHLGGGNTKRNPLFCWDVDPENGFAVSNERMLLDVKGEIRFPMVGFTKLSPVVNNRQIMTYRVTSILQREDTEQSRALTREVLDHCGAY